MHSMARTMPPGRKAASKIPPMTVTSAAIASAANTAKGTRGARSLASLILQQDSDPRVQELGHYTPPPRSSAECAPICSRPLRREAPVTIQRLAARPSRVPAAKPSSAYPARAIERPKNVRASEEYAAADLGRKPPSRPPSSRRLGCRERALARSTFKADGVCVRLGDYTTK